MTEPLIQRLQDLRLRRMAAALEQQLASADRAAPSFEERLGLLMQHERVEHSSLRRAQRVR